MFRRFLDTLFRNDGIYVIQHPRWPQSNTVIFVATENANIPKSRYHLKIVGTKKLIQSKFRTEDRKMLGTTLQYFIARVTGHPELSTPNTNLIMSSHFDEV